jgi:hypothetical protein
MTSPTRTTRTAALSLWALRALAVVVVAIVGAASSPGTHASAQLDVSSIVRTATGMHDLAALASSARRVEGRGVVAARGDRAVAPFAPALPTSALFVFTAAERAPAGASRVARIDALAGRRHLSVVSARGPPVVA